MSMHSFRHAFFTAIVAASLAMSASAAADGNDIEVVRQLAEQSFKSGLSWYKKGDYQRALVEFQKANAVFPRASTMRNIGLCEMKLGRPLDALKHLRAAVNAPDLKPDVRQIAQQEVDDAYGATGHIVVRANEGATLSLDGQDVGLASKEPLDVLPGSHKLDSRLGAQTSHAEVVAMPGTTTTADLFIAPAAPAPAAPTSAAPAPVISPDASLPPSDKPATFWTLRREVGVGVAGVGVVSLILAGYFHGQAQNAESQAGGLTSQQSSSACELGTPPSSCSTLSSLKNQMQQDGSWEVGLIISGALELAAGAVLIVWPTSASSTARSAAIAPYVSPRGSGLQLRGEF